MLSTLLYFLVFILPKVLLSIFFGVIMLLISLDIFILSFPERSIELLFAFIDLVVFVMSLGTCSSLDEFNAKQKKDNLEQIDPFDFL